MTKIQLLCLTGKYNIKQLITGPAGNSEFCSHETLNEGNIEVKTRGKKTHCLLYSCTSQLKSGEKTAKKWFALFTLAGSEIFRDFKEQNLITCEKKVHVLVSLGS